MRRRDFLLSAGAGAAALAAGGTRPNIVILLSDDLGWRDLSSYGSHFYQTPNIDRLAREGVRFTDAYAACPVCSPTRASILTGRYPPRFGLTDWIPGRPYKPGDKLRTPEFEQQLPLSEQTLADVLKAEGYQTGAVGKWHLGGPPYYPERRGFDVNVGGTEKGSPPSYFPPYRIPGVTPRSEKDYLTDNLAERAAGFIRENRQRPFFLYYANFAVHTPLMSKPELTAKYRARVEAGNCQSNAVYGGMVESMDDSVGRVLGELETQGIADRTVVVFLSDNGGEGTPGWASTCNAPLRKWKGHLYEGGIRVPFIVRWPGKIRPGVSATPVSSVDLFPTVLDLAGVRAETRNRLDGRSLARVLRGSEKLDREALYWHYPHYSPQGGVPSSAVRKGDFKLIEFFETGQTELYNLRDDIGEQHDLARELPERRNELHALLKRWREEVHAALPAPVTGETR